MTAAYNRLIADLQNNGLTVIDAGSTAKAQCPAHDDTNPSLGIAAIEGRVLVYCHAGCTANEIVTSLGRTLADLFDNKRGASYLYPDGRQPRRTPTKQFSQSGNTKGTALFRADKITEDVQTVYVPEGEQDVLAIEAAGGVAVCNAMGAGKAHLFDWSPLAGKTVVIVADNDDPGRKHAAEVAALLAGIAASVRIVVARTGKDASDHIAAGHTLDEFVDLDLSPATDSEAPRVWKATDLKPATQPRWLAKGRLQCAATNLLCGDEGIGKSLLWVWIAAAVTTGKPLPEFGIPEREAADVLLVVTEDDWSSTVLPRLEVAGADLERVSVICVERDGSGAPVFPRDINLIAETKPRPALVVIDAWLDTVPPGLRVRDPQDARVALHGWKELATETGAAVLLLVHTNRINSASTRDRYGATYALRQKARVTLYAQCDEEGRLLVGPDKMNNGSPVPASIFTIKPIQHFEPTPDDDGTVPLLMHAGTSDRTASQHVADRFEDDHGDDQSTTKNAAEWLQGYLEAEGPHADRGHVVRAAAKNGFKERTLQKACKKLGIVYGKSGFGGDIKVTWSLPTQAGAYGAYGENEGIHAGHTSAPHTRLEGDAGANGAQMADQQKQDQNGHTRHTRPEIHTAAPLILRDDDYRRPGCVCIGQPRPCYHCERAASKHSEQATR